MQCPECGDPLDDGQTLCCFCWALLVVLSEENEDDLSEVEAGGDPWGDTERLGHPLIW